MSDEQTFKVDDKTLMFVCGNPSCRRSSMFNDLIKVDLGKVSAVMSKISKPFEPIEICTKCHDELYEVFMEFLYSGYSVD